MFLVVSTNSPSVCSYLASEQVDDLERVLDDPNGQQLLAVVATVHHHAVAETLDDRAQGLAETLGSVAPGRVRHETGRLLLHRYVILFNDEKQRLYTI